MIKSDKNTGKIVLDAQGLKGVSLLQIPGAEVVEISLEEGASIEMHTMPTDVVFYVRQGVCSISIGDEAESICAGTAVFSPAGVPKSIEGGPAVVLAIKIQK